MINYLQELMCKIFNRSYTYSFCYQYIDNQERLRLGSAIRGFTTKDITIQKIIDVEQHSKKLHNLSNNFVISFSYMGWLKPEEINEIV